MDSERMYTARIHRPDGSTELLGIETQGGEPVSPIEISSRENPFELSHRFYELRSEQTDAPETYDYDLPVS